MSGRGVTLESLLIALIVQHHVGSVPLTGTSRRTKGPDASPLPDNHLPLPDTSPTSSQVPPTPSQTSPAS